MVNVKEYQEACEKTARVLEDKEKQITDARNYVEREYTKYRLINEIETLYTQLAKR